MTQLKIITSLHDLSQEHSSSIPPLSPEDFQLHAPDRHLLVKDAGGFSLARCSIWIQSGRFWQGKRLGVLGHYYALDQSHGSWLLKQACEQLIQLGCDAVVGPMNGSTWFSYRFITERGTTPTFFLEPDHPPEWVDHFTVAKFKPLTHYFSSWVPDLAILDPRMARVEERIYQLGVTVHSLKDQQLEQHLTSIYHLCLRSFAPNFLYTPIDRERFFALYRPITPYIQPELIQLAYHQDELVGLAFTIPDLTQAQRREDVDTLVIKTVAVDPRRDYAGLGSLLTQKCRLAASQMGMQRGIHALMHENNPSRNTLGQITKPFRRYSLFYWEPQ